MMGHRGVLKGTAEWDALTWWKNVLHWRPGERKRIKRKYNKRQRKIWRRIAKDVYCLRVTHPGGQSINVISK
jgi:hypothetical protein